MLTNRGPDQEPQHECGRSGAPTGGGNAAGEAGAPREYPAPPTVAEVLLSALPAELQANAKVTRAAGIVMLRFVDESGHAHVLEARPLAGPAFVKGEVLGFAHGPTPAGVPAFDLGQRYREILNRLRERETEIAPFVLFDEAQLSDAGRGEQRDDGAAPARGQREPGQRPHSVAYVAEREFMDRFAGVAQPDLEGALQRWLDERFAPGDAAEVHLYLETSCRQACEFCPVPFLRTVPRWQSAMAEVARAYETGHDLAASGVFARLMAALARRALPSTLCLTGHDWAENPRAGRYLELLARERNVRVVLAGPSTRLADRDFAAQALSLPNLERVVVSLLASDPTVHDAVVGRPGAFAEVVAAIAAVQARKKPLQINTVLTARTVSALPATLAWAAARGLRLYLVAFTPDLDAPSGAFEGVMPPADAIRDALSACAPEASAAVEALAGVPLCAVPEPLRAAIAPGSIGDQRETRSFPDACGACAECSRCPGVTDTYVRLHGSRGLNPVRSAPATAGERPVTSAERVT